MKSIDAIREELRSILHTARQVGQENEPMEPLKALVAQTVAASTPWILVDDKGTIVEASEMADQMFGEIPGGLMGKSVHDLLPQRLRERHAQHFGMFWKAPTPRMMGHREGMGLLGLKADGTEFPVEISLYPRAFSGKKYVVATILPVRVEKAKEAV